MNHTVFLPAEEILSQSSEQVDPQRSGFDDRKLLECKDPLKDREILFCPLGPPDQEALSGVLAEYRVD